jgi:hypothetical protein
LAVLVLLIQSSPWASRFAAQYKDLPQVHGATNCTRSHSYLTIGDVPTGAS